MLAWTRGGKGQRAHDDVEQNVFRLLARAVFNKE